MADLKGSGVLASAHDRASFLLQRARALREEVRGNLRNRTFMSDDVLMEQYNRLAQAAALLFPDEPALTKIVLMPDAVTQAMGSWVTVSPDGPSRRLEARIGELIAALEWIAEGLGCAGAPGQGAPTAASEPGSASAGPGGRNAVAMTPIAVPTPDDLSKWMTVLAEATSLLCHLKRTLDVWRRKRGDTPPKKVEPKPAPGAPKVMLDDLEQKVNAEALALHIDRISTSLTTLGDMVRQLDSYRQTQASEPLLSPKEKAFLASEIPRMEKRIDEEAARLQQLLDAVYERD